MQKTKQKNKNDLNAINASKLVSKVQLLAFASMQHNSNNSKQQQVTQPLELFRNEFQMHITLTLHLSSMQFIQSLSHKLTYLHQYWLSHIHIYMQTGIHIYHLTLSHI